MDEAAERLYQEALHPARRAGRIWLEPAETGDGSEILCFGGNGNTTAVQLTDLDLDELDAVLLARRELAAARACVATALPPDPSDEDAAAVERVLKMLEA